jgi:small-conductance mechanosensitive channel
MFALYAGLTAAGILLPFAKLILIGVVAWGLLIVVKMLQIFIDYYHGGFAAKSPEENAMILANTARQAAKTAAWAVAGFTVLSLAGVNVGALIAGFGVIGVTIGLASQNIAGDIFKAVLMRFNAPFKTGDRIQLPTVSGTVEELTLFTTKLKGDDGSAVVLKNAEIPFESLKNLGPKGPAQQSVLFVLPFNTAAEKIESIVAMGKEAVGKENRAIFAHVSVKGLVTAGLQCELSYLILPEHIAQSAAVSHAVLVSFVDRLVRAGVEFKA